jgi:hypothetical protein
MGLFTIFSHGTERGTDGLRRTELEGNERTARRAARELEVLGYEVDDIVETNCQESGQRMRQVKRQVRERR